MRNFIYEWKDYEAGNAMDLKFTLFRRGYLLHKDKPYAEFFMISLPWIFYSGGLNRPSWHVSDPVHCMIEYGWFYPMFITKTIYASGKHGEDKRSFWKRMPVKTWKVRDPRDAKIGYKVYHT